MATQATLTTQEVANLVGVDKTTLLRWLWRGELREPRFVRVGRIANRLWGAADVRRAREHMKRNYRKRNRQGEGTWKNSS